MVKATGHALSRIATLAFIIYVDSRLLGDNRRPSIRNGHIIPVGQAIAYTKVSFHRTIPIKTLQLEQPPPSKAMVP